MIIKQHKLYVPKLEDFADINDFLKACSLYNELIEKRIKMKGYTDLEQSKKLAEILTVESADMRWEQVDLITGDTEWRPLLGLDVAIKDNLFSYRNGYTIPCWSLAALLDVLKDNIKIEKTQLGQSDMFTYSIVGDGYNYRTYEHKELIDACVEMIVKLNELNLLKL